MIEIEGLALQLQFARLNLGDVQNVGDEALQRRTGVADQANHLGLFNTELCA